MAQPLKIDPVELNRLLSEGKSTKEIACYFNCSPGAVSQQKRKLGVEICKKSAQMRNAAVNAAPGLIRNADDAKGQLSVLIARCNEELDWIKDSVQKKADDKYRIWQDAAIKHIAEIRKLVSTMADIEFKLNHVSIVQKALLIMFQEIGNESRECQKRIRDRLERASILFFMDD